MGDLGGNRASSRKEARQALIELKEKWVKIYPEVVKRWEEDFKKPYYLCIPRKLEDLFYTTNQLERLMKEIKRRTRVIEVFPEPEAVYKVIYLVLSEMKDTAREACQGSRKPFLNSGKSFYLQTHLD
ncbi:MAG: transposase [Thermodesulforhabdaceae bacterium]